MDFYRNKCKNTNARLAQMYTTSLRPFHSTLYRLYVYTKKRTKSARARF